MLVFRAVNYVLLALLLVMCNYGFAGVQIGSTAVCNGDTTTLYNLSNIAHTASVKWDLDNNGFYNDAVGDSVKYVFSSWGTAYVNIEIIDSSGNEYFNASPLPVTVYANPVANFSYSGICNGQTTMFSNLSSIPGTDTLQYNWNFGSSGVIGSIQKNPSVVYPSSGNYTCLLSVTSNHGCANAYSVVVVIATNPTADFIYADTCQGSGAMLVNTSHLYNDSISQAIWSLGDGTLSFKTDTVFHTYVFDTIYPVKLIIRNSHGCADTIGHVLNIRAAVHSTYSFNPDSVIYAGYSTQIAVTGNFSSIVWEDNSTDSTRTVSDSGDYRFTVSNQWGCSQTQVSRVRLISNVPAIQKANDIITPNGDGVNDLLVFQNLENFNSCNLKIYNVEGLEVFSSEVYKNEWDAKNHGKLVNAGAYYYVIICDGKYELKGNTNVVR